MGTYLRNFPQHERRQNELIFEEEGEPPVRAKRKPRNLPHSWWDVRRGDIRDRSWKSARRQQNRETGGE
jgi:hypothetical protein